MLKVVPSVRSRHSVPRVPRGDVLALISVWTPSYGIEHGPNLRKHEVIITSTGTRIMKDIQKEFPPL